MDMEKTTEQVIGIIGASPDGCTVKEIAELLSATGKATSKQMQTVRDILKALDEQGALQFAAKPGADRRTVWQLTEEGAGALARLISDKDVEANQGNPLTAYFFDESTVRHQIWVTPGVWMLHQPQPTA